MTADRKPPREVRALLEKVRAAYGTDAYRQKNQAPVTNPRVMPLIEEAASAGLLTIDRSELPMMAHGPHITIAPDGCFVRLTEKGLAMLAARIVPEDRHD